LSIFRAAHFRDLLKPRFREENLPPFPEGKQDSPEEFMYYEQLKAMLG